MTKEYFCRNTLRDLREKTEGFPVPLQKRSGPEPSFSPPPIRPAQKPDPFYLHPKNTAPTTNPQKQNTTVTFKVVSGENNPSKKPVLETRKYEEISNWKEGCPDCLAKPATYGAFRTHRSRGCGPGEKVLCQKCGKLVSKSNTTHFKNCPNKK